MDIVILLLVLRLIFGFDHVYLMVANFDAKRQQTKVKGSFEISKDLCFTYVKKY